MIQDLTPLILVDTSLMRTVKMQDNKAYLVWVVLGIIGVLLLIISAFAGINQLKKATEEAEMINNLPVINYADFVEVASGSLIAITGRLQPVGEVSRPEDLIVYYEQTWNVEDNDEDDWTGQWETYTFAIPNFMVELSSGSIPVIGVDRTIIELPTHTVIVAEPKTGIVVNGITEGTMRQQGFRGNDLITVVGNKNQDGLVPSRITGGSREDLLTHLTYRASGLRIAAIIFGLIGLVLIFIAARNLLK
jgi:hypothetical protein